MSKVYMVLGNDPDVPGYTNIYFVSTNKDSVIDYAVNRIMEREERAAKEYEVRKKNIEEKIDFLNNQIAALYVVSDSDGIKPLIEESKKKLKMQQMYKALAEKETPGLHDAEHYKNNLKEYLKTYGLSIFSLDSDKEIDFCVDDVMGRFGYYDVD